MFLIQTISKKESLKTNGVIKKALCLKVLPSSLIKSVTFSPSHVYK